MRLSLPGVAVIDVEPSCWLKISFDREVMNIKVDELTYNNIQVNARRRIVYHLEQSVIGGILKKAVVEQIDLGTILDGRGRKLRTPGTQHGTDGLLVLSGIHLIISLFITAYQFR